MPKATAELVKVCQRLEKHYRDMQDIEFTIEQRQALHAADPQRQAHRHAARARSPSTWCRERLITRTTRSCASSPTSSTSSCTRASTRRPKQERHRQGPARVARRGDRARSSSPPTTPRSGVKHGENVILVPQRDLARGHPRHDVAAGHPHRARRHDQPRGGRRPRHGQALRRRAARRSSIDYAAQGSFTVGGRTRSRRRATSITIDGTTGEVIARPGRRRSRPTLHRRLRRADDVGRRASRTLKVRTNADTPDRRHASPASSAPRASACAAPSTCSSTPTASTPCAR